MEIPKLLSKELLTAQANSLALHLKQHGRGQGLQRNVLFAGYTQKATR